MASSLTMLDLCIQQDLIPSELFIDERPFEKKLKNIKFSVTSSTTKSTDNVYVLSGLHVNYTCFW